MIGLPDLRCGGNPLLYEAIIDLQNPFIH